MCLIKKLKKNSRRLLQISSLLLVAWLLQGCKAVQSLNPKGIYGPGYEPENVHHASSALVPEIRRVAVLPVVAGRSDHNYVSGVQTLEPILYAELTKSGAFEVVQPSEEQWIEWTGAAQWTAEQVLPKDFFENIANETGCDAVLFSKITEYHPYRPIRIGWSVKLVDAKNAEILWAMDEVFDAADPRVAASARRHFSGDEASTMIQADNRSVLYSPRRFGKYTAEALIGAMTPREIPVKVSSTGADLDSDGQN